MTAVVKKRTCKKEVYLLAGDQGIALVMQKDADGLSGFRIRV